MMMMMMMMMMMLETSEDISSKSREMFADVGMVLGANLPHTVQTSV